MRTLAITFILFQVDVKSCSSSFALLDLPTVSYTLIPASDFCISSDDTAPFLILVHSAPDNVALRNAVRETWGGVRGARTTFLLGAVEAGGKQTALEREHEEHGDLVQGTFVDAYRNMTYKHLMGYRWAADNCPDVRFVLKSDDDQAVDTLHLQTYVKGFVELDRKFYLCQIIRSPKVQRYSGSKWFVTKEEYVLDYYPSYCAGWAYATNVRTIRSVLSTAENRSDYFWIDDVFVTGILRPADANVYDWQKAFLNTHSQHEDDVVKGKGFSPELMVASDLKPDEIRHVFRKFRNSHDQELPQRLIYSDPKTMALIEPANVKNEL